MFASLFDEITAESYTATQALNPGFFFKEAADYAKKRKISAVEICQVDKAFLEIYNLDLYRYNKNYMCESYRCDSVV